MPELNGIVPARWVMPLWPTKFDQIVFINWLDIEIPGKYQPSWLSGWRNREVYHYIKSYDWTAGMFEAPIKLENIRFAKARS